MFDANNISARSYLCDIKLHYMANSVSGQDESNPALWLATRAGKMELSCPLGTTRRVPQEKFPQKPYNKSFIDQVWGQDGWILAKFFFCEFMNLDSVTVHKHAKKELGQYPAILTSHLVNNPYIMSVGWLQNYFNTIQTPNTIENRNAIRYNLRIFTRIFSLLNRLKNKSIQPRPEKQYSY